MHHVYRVCVFVYTHACACFVNSRMPLSGSRCDSPLCCPSGNGATLSRSCADVVAELPDLCPMAAAPPGVRAALEQIGGQAVRGLRRRLGGLSEVGQRQPARHQTVCPRRTQGAYGRTRQCFGNNDSEQSAPRTQDQLAEGDERPP